MATEKLGPTTNSPANNGSLEERAHQFAFEATGLILPRRAQKAHRERLAQEDPEVKKRAVEIILTQRA